MDKITR